MARLAQTPGLTDVQQSILETVREFADKEIIPHAQRLEHADEYPDRDPRRHAGDGPVRPDHRRGVRRARRVAADLRAGGGGAVAGLDVDVRHRQHALHRGVPDLPARLGRAEGQAAAADGHRRGARRVLHVRAGCGSDVAGDQDEGGPRRRRLRPQRPEDVADQRRLLVGGGDPGQDRPRRRLGLRQHDHVPAGEGAGLRRDRARPDHPRQDREDGLQGRRDDRDGPRRRHGCRTPPCSAARTRSVAASTR